MSPSTPSGSPRQSAPLLQGRAVFLSASTPSPERSTDFLRIPDAQREIERAVVSVARSVFAVGGRLVFGGHPSISPLVALVASEYAARTTQPQPLVTVHQLDVFRLRGEVPDATVAMERLGHARIVWHPTDPTELNRQWRKGEVRYPVSLTRMRKAMVTDPSIAAMLAIGGMEGVLDETKLFENVKRGPIFVLATTGGASALLAGPLGDTKVSVPAIGVQVLDRDFIEPPAPRLVGPDGEARNVPLRFTPYSLLVQEMLEKLV